VLQGVRDLLVHQDALARQLAFHSPANSAVQAAMGEVVKDVTALHETGDLSLVFASGHAFANGVWIRAGRRVWEASVTLGRRLAALSSRGMVLRRGITPRTLLELVQALRTAVDQPEAAAARVRALAGAGVDLLTGDQAETEADADDRLVALSAFEQGLASLDRRSASRMDVYARRRRRSLLLTLVRLVEEHPRWFLALTAIRDQRLPEAAGPLRVCVWSLALGRSLGLGRASLLELGLSALLHDVGQAAQPADLVSRPGPLTDEERAQMQEHPLRGMIRLLAEGGMTGGSLHHAIVAAEHHLRFDGGEGSYPYLGRPLHPFSRIVAVADTFDALTSARPHRPAFDPPRALELLVEDAGRRLDPAVVGRLVRIAGRRPPGTVVELVSRRVAITLGPGDTPEGGERPRVLVLAGSAFKTDVSVYGARDLAGGQQEFCGDGQYGTNARLRPTRGGTWTSDAMRCRLTWRAGYRPTVVKVVTGFRLVRSA